MSPVGLSLGQGKHRDTDTCPRSLRRWAVLRSCACEQDLRADTCLKNLSDKPQKFGLWQHCTGAGLWSLGCSWRAEGFGGCSLDPETPVGLPQTQDTGSGL